MALADITIIGNLAADPELRFTPSGKAVANFTVMTSRAVKDENTNEWTDKDTTGWRCTVWDQYAENVAESFQRGDRVIVLGRARWRSWDKDDGTKGGAMEVDAFEVAAVVKNATVKISKVRRSEQQQPAGDPWAAAPGNPYDEPPF